MYSPLSKKMQRMCPNCELEYEMYNYTIPATEENDYKVGHGTDSVWCRKRKICCIFCENYLPMRDERINIMKNCNYHYLWSGAVNEQAFTKLYVEYVDRWCDRWHIRNTDDCEAVRTELRAVRNWTREYWH